MARKKFAIAADHGGVELKDALVKSLGAEFDVSDFGTHGKDSVDYPDFAKKACDAVASGEADFGVLVCTTGIGMSIAANKIAGIRAALCLNDDSAKFSRLHNNANVICIGAKYVAPQDAERFVKTFAATEFEGGRHARRVAKFMDFGKEC